MKLRNKIFISILFVSLATLLLSSYYLINRTHLDNVAREQERSLNDLEFICSSIESSLNTGYDLEDKLTLILTRYADYYKQKGIYLMLYRHNERLYSEFRQAIQSSFSNLLTLDEASWKLQIFNFSGKHYIIVSSTITVQKLVLVYARSIEDIYHARNTHIWLTTLFSAVMTLILSLLSFLYSRWITKPIEMLSQSANAISQGNYSIRITGFRDEFNELGQAYNKMASAIESHTKELKEKADELQIFIDDLSHEMNTPLTSIQGYSEFLISANATDEQKQKAAQTIRTEARRMNDIYTKLLTLSLIREYSPDISEINVNDLFEEIKATFLPQLQENQIKLYYEYEDISLYADRTMIYLILSNLVKNSIHAIQTGGKIQMRAYKNASDTILEVSDDGCGIPQDKIEDVVKPFFRLDKSRSRKTGGAGLGLSICNKVAKLHHAQLVITSDSNQGTVVRFIMKAFDSKQYTS